MGATEIVVRMPNRRNILGHMGPSFVWSYLQI